MGSTFPPDCYVSLPLSATEYYRLYFATDGNSTFRDLVCEVQDRAVESSETWEEGRLKYERLQTLPNYEKWVPRIGRAYVKPKDIAFTDVFEFDPELIRQPPYRVRVRTTLPFLGSRFESVRTITISDEVPGVSCRHTLTGFVRVGIIGVGHHVERSILQNTLATLQALRTAVCRYKEMQGEQALEDSDVGGAQPLKPQVRLPAADVAAGKPAAACVLANGWHGLPPAQAGPEKPVRPGLGRGSPPWAPPVAACGRDALLLGRTESAVSGESVYFDAGECLEGMRSPRSPCGHVDGHAWPACGDGVPLLRLFAGAWEESCVLWRRPTAGRGGVTW